MNSVSSLVILFFLFMLSACQPEGGELLPIGSEGVEIATSRFENDTVVINDNGLKLKFYGNWTGNSYIQLRIAIANESSQRYQIKFEQAVLKNGNGEIANISDINEKPGLKNIYGNDKERKLPTIILEANEKKSFLVTFSSLTNIMNAAESAKIFDFSLPFEGGGKIKQYNVRFKAIDQKDNSGKSDPSDW